MFTRKKISAVISLILVLSIFCSASAFAADADIQGSKQIAGTHAAVAWSNTTPGRMGIFYSIICSGDMDKIGASKVEIYRYLNGKWEVEETISAEDYPDMLGSDRSSYQVTIAYSTMYLNVPYYAIVYFYAEGPYGISTGNQRTDVI